MTDESSFPSEINENNQNKNTVRCQFCNSIILKAKSANYVEQEVRIPTIISLDFAFRFDRSQVDLRKLIYRKRMRGRKMSQKLIPVSISSAHFHLIGSYLSDFSSSVYP